MSDENAEKDIVKKLDKVADSLESTTSQLSSVVTQQQLDLIRERVSKCEADLTSIKDTLSVIGDRSSESEKKLSCDLDVLAKNVVELERDYAAVRSLMFSSFALSTVAVIGLVICSIYL